MQRLAVLEAQMVAAPDQQISLTDPDARSMATSGRGSGVVGYNVQVAVETEHHLIITHEVTNVGSDRAQLATMAKEAKAVLQTERLDAVADRGYFSGEEILACEEAGITVTLPKPMTSNAKAEGRFGKQDFRYVAEEDVYICPAGERLAYHSTNEEHGSSCTATGPMPAKLRHQAQLHHRQGATDHPLGARACSRGVHAGSTSIRRRCASGARRSSTPSARSRPHGSDALLMKTLRVSRARWRCTSSPTISHAS